MYLCVHMALPKTLGVWMVFGAGPKACQQCPAGTAANNYGQTECQECNFGYRTYSSGFLDQLEPLEALFPEENP